MSRLRRRRSGALLWAVLAGSLHLGRLATIVGLTAACCLATPYGVVPIAHIEDVRRASAGLVTEWQPVGLSSPEQVLALVALLFGAAAGCSAWRARRLDSVAVLLLLGVATAFAIRFSPMLAFLAIPELAAAASRIAARPIFVSRMCAAGCAVLAAFTISGLGSFSHPGTRFSSPALVAALPHGCKLLNDDGVGGAVILARPDVRVFIDGRNDMYGRGLELYALAMLTDVHGALPRIASAGVTCVLAPTEAPVVTALKLDSHWRVGGTDDVRTLLVLRSD